MAALTAGVVSDSSSADPFIIVQICNHIADLYNHGKEIDCLLVDGDRVTPVEVKSGKTISNSYLDNLKYWRSLAALPDDQGYVVYGGDESIQISSGILVSWRNMDLIPN